VTGSITGIPASGILRNVRVSDRSILD